MTALPAGLLIPESLLTTSGFVAFSLFVALNTVIYLGLTLAKFVPWPTPVRPVTVRRLLPEVADKEPHMPPSLSHVSGQSDETETHLRKAEARTTIPLGLGLVGALTVLVGLVNAVLYLNTMGPAILIGAVLGLALLVLSQLLARTSLSDNFMIWSWTSAMLVLLGETAWRAAVLDSAVLLAYSAMALIIIAPISMSWAAGITAAAIGVIPIAIAGSLVSVVDTVSWSIAAVTAALASLVLLRLRLVAVSRLAAEQQRSTALSSTDPTTGAFTRTGLLALAPTVADAATRSGADVCVVICDVTDLRALNEQYGLTYGDDILRVNVRALWQSLPEGALVAHWSGSDLLCLCIGSIPDNSAIHADVTAALETSGICLGKRKPTLSIGSATGDPATTTLEGLLAQAWGDLESAEVSMPEAGTP
jgi:diguanylate cyclase (GGDEF)-like protein